MRTGTAPDPRQWQLSPFVGSRSPARRPYSNGLRALAAGIFLAIAAGGGWYFWPAGISYATPVGGLAVVPVSDGSKVVLNTASEIRVAVTDAERRIVLKQGEAFFEVTRDPRRPFVVEAAGRRIVAVGTKFAVRRQGSDVKVVVTEGAVKLEGVAPQARVASRNHAEQQFAVNPDKGNGDLLLTAGAIARAAGRAVTVKRDVLGEVEESLSWRTGYLVFKEVPLEEAVAEFNRYNERKIMIEDAAVAGIRLSGNFRSTNVDAFIRLVEEGFPVQGRQVDGGIVLISR
jgi:transmembrane sensor